MEDKFYNFERIGKDLQGATWPAGHVGHFEDPLRLTYEFNSKENATQRSRDQKMRAGMPERV